MTVRLCLTIAKMYLKVWSITFTDRYRIAFIGEKKKQFIDKVIFLHTPSDLASEMKNELYNNDGKLQYSLPGLGRGQRLGWCCPVCLVAQMCCSCTCSTTWSPSPQGCWRVYASPSQWSLQEKWHEKASTLFGSFKSVEKYIPETLLISQW